MADDEVKEESGESGGGLMSGNRGWIIVIAVVVLEAAFFAVLLFLKNDTKDPDTTISAAGNTTMTPAQVMATPEIPLTGLTYSIPQVSGPPMTLAMSLLIVMGETPNERREGIKVPPMAWLEYENVTKRWLPWVKDQLNQRINKMTANELGTDRGQQLIRSFVKDKLNTRLKDLDMSAYGQDKNSRADRVQEVLITNFYLN